MLGYGRLEYQDNASKVPFSCYFLVPKFTFMRLETCQDGIELNPRPHCCKHIKPNSKSIVILIESFNIMENVQLGWLLGMREN